MKENITSTDVRNIVVDEIKDYRGPADFELGANFKNDLGFDSLEYMYLIVRVENKLKLNKLNEIELNGLDTPADLIKYICDRI